MKTHCRRLHLSYFVAVVSAKVVIVTLSPNSNLLENSRSKLLETLVLSLSLSLSHTHTHIIFKLSDHFLINNFLKVVMLLDYGAGNVRSVRNAIRHLGFDIKDVSYFHIFLIIFIIF